MDKDKKSAKYYLDDSKSNEDKKSKGKDVEYNEKMDEKKTTTQKKDDTTKKKDEGSLVSSKSAEDKKKKDTSSKSSSKKSLKSSSGSVKIKRKTKKKDNSVIVYGIAVIVLIAVVIALANIDRIFSNQEIVPDTDIDEGVVAYVDGIAITQEDIEQQYAIIPEYLRNSVTREMILDGIIEELVILMEAERQGVTVTDEEVNQQIEMVLMQNGLSREMFLEQLAYSDMTEEDFIELYRNQMMISKLIQGQISSHEMPTEEEMRNFYEQNKNHPQITTQKNVRARHILVEEESLAEELLERIILGESFEVLAQNYSTDLASATQGGDLGYFPQGAMVPAFDEVVFSMAIDDEPRIVSTQFGYHIVDVTGIQEAQLKSFEEARNDIEQILIEQKQQEAVSNYVAQLKNDVDIIIVDYDNTDRSQSEGNSELSAGIETFSVTDDEICTKDGKPIIRVYTTTTCPYCEWIKETARDVLKEYDELGMIEAYHWEMNNQNNLLTDIVEGEVPESEMMAYTTANPQGYVPFYNFGCKYVRIGNGHGDLASEEAEFRAVIEDLVASAG